LTISLPRLYSNLKSKENMLMHSTIPPVSGGFDNLKLISPIQRAVREEKYTLPTPIQTQAIPHLLMGRDLLGCAQTGTGKTAAFALPILQRLAENQKTPRPKSMHALILTPTRELAVQISDSFRTYGRYLKINHAVVYGGVKYNAQIRALSRGLDIVVATPGRLLDLFEQGHLRMDEIDVLPDIRRIISAIPEERQTMLFSATLPDEIVKISKRFLRDPVQITVSPPSSTVEKIDQKVLFVDRENKYDLLESVLQDETMHRVLIFARTKHGSNRIVQKLSKIKVRAVALHGNKSQAARLEALKKFRDGKVRVLVATDIASRGLDVDGISHVVNYELPNEPESYVHRIGRTARAGTEGIAISFCDAGERGFLRDIERVIKRAVEVDEDHAFHSHAVAASNKRSNGDGKKNWGAKKGNNGQRPGKPKFSSNRGKRTNTKSGENKVGVPRRFSRAR
jgi:ATP-dependent RNA helicase RhlE